MFDYSCDGQSTGQSILSGASGLLLTEAVQRSQAKNEIHAVDADDLTIGEELGQGVQRDPISGVVEGWYQDEAIGDVEVGVASRQPMAIEADGCGYRKRHDAKRVAVLVNSGMKPRPILLKGLMIGVGLVGFDHGHNRPRIDEPGKIVDVAVGVVAGDAPAQPDDIAYAQVISKNLLQLRTLKTGIAALDLA